MKGRTFGADASVVESTLVPAGTLQDFRHRHRPQPSAVLPRAGRQQAVRRLGHPLRGLAAAARRVEPQVPVDGRRRLRRTVELPAKRHWTARWTNSCAGATPTASTDTGHLSTEQWWAIGHPEKATDYLYRAKHVTTVAAKAIIAAYYGQPPSRSYFSSCSNGGRQGLIEAQRYPDDFDGLIIGAPWNFQSHSNAGFIWDAQALAAPGASDSRGEAARRSPPPWSPRATRTTAWPTASLPIRDAATSIRKSLTCKRRGREQLPDAAAGGGAAEDLRRSEESANRRIDLSGLRARFRSGLDGHGAADDRRDRVCSSTSRTSCTRIREWDLQSFNFDSDMAHTDQTIGRLGNATSTDYSAAIRRGVKIIQYHGWNDQTLQPAYSPQYYEQVAKANGGLEKTQEFYRLFMVPGMNALQRRHRRVELRRRRAADSAGARRGARSA